MSAVRAVPTTKRSTIFLRRTTGPVARGGYEEGVWRPTEQRVATHPAQDEDCEALLILVGGDPEPARQLV